MTLAGRAAEDTLLAGGATTYSNGDLKVRPGIPLGMLGEVLLTCTAHTSF